MKKISDRRKKGFLVFLFFISVQIFTFAQTINVTGIVTDSKGELLPGVNILIVGTTQGTISDVDGSYTIGVPSDGQLKFQFLGFTPQVIDVNNRTKIDIILEADIVGLEEVIVVGYGTMKKSDLTGSLVSVSTDAITKSVPTSIDQVLQGRAAGVQVQQNSGMPGASTSIRVRGINSLSASSEPIYVIDGIIIDGGSTSSTNTNTNALASINPCRYCFYGYPERCFCYCHLWSPWF